MDILIIIIILFTFILITIDFSLSNKGEWKIKGSINIGKKHTKKRTKK